MKAVESARGEAFLVVVSLLLFVLGNVWAKRGAAMMQQAKDYPTHTMKAFVGGLAVLASLLCALIVLPAQALAADPPTDVTWQDLNPNTTAQLSGYYQLTASMNAASPKNLTVADDTYIDLKGFTLQANDSGKGVLFTVPAGKKLVIYGNGRGAAGIKGYDKAFQLANGATLELNNVDVDGAFENAVYAEASDIKINLDNARIVNTEHGGAEGAIYVKGQRPTITGANESSIEKSSVKHRYGGGIHIEGSNATIKGLKFKDHDTKREGGAVWVDGVSTQIEDCTFENNTTELSGGGVYIMGHHAKVKNCTFKNNSAYYTSALKSVGLSLSLLLSVPLDFITMSGDFFGLGQFSLTDALWGENSNQSYAGDHGGAICIKGGWANIENINASGNWCNEHGGTIYIDGGGNNIKGGTIAGGIGYIGGGGISMKGNENTVDGVNLAACVAMSYGGGIELEGNNNTVKNVTAFKCGSRGDGGGIYLNGNENTVQDTRTRRCETIDNGGGIGVAGQKATIKNVDVGICKAHTDKGGGLYLAGTSHKVLDSSFYQNQSAKDYGGAVYVEDDNVEISGCTFRGNEAGFVVDMIGAFPNVIDDFSEPFFTPIAQKIERLAGASTDHGGAIFSDGENTSVKNSTFTENCGKDGGAIYFNQPGALLERCTFTDNAAQRDGGAVDFDAGNTTVSKCVMRDNTALRYGGAIYYDGSGNVLAGSEDEGAFIERNKASTAKNYGHGVFVDDTDLTLRGKIVIRDNNNLDIASIADVTDDDIPTWSNLCLYDDAELSVPYTEAIEDGSEIWVDSDWGHYKAPEGGYIYHASSSPALSVKGFKSDRAGYHFVEKSNTLYYAKGDETVGFDELKAPTVSRKPIDDVWTTNPGRIYIDIDTPYENVEKNFTVTLAIDGGTAQPVEVKQDADGRDFVDVVGEKGSSYVYHFDLGYAVSLASPAGGTVSKDSPKTVADYQVECQTKSSRVKIQSAYESIGELVVEDLGKGVEGAVFEYSGMRYPVAREGQLVTGWKAQVDGEAAERDIDVEWDQAANSIKLTLPGDLDGREILLLPQRELKTYKVTYALLPSDAQGIVLPGDTLVQHGGELVIEPLGDSTGMRSIGSSVNGKATWGRDPYSVTVTSDVLVMYFAEEESAYTVTFEDDANLMQAVFPSMEYGFQPGQSFTGAEFNPRDSQYKMYVIDHFQVLHDEPVLDDEGNPTYDDQSEPVTEEVFNESVTLGVDDAVLGPQTLKPVWVQRVEVQADERSDDVLAKEFSLEGGTKSGEQWTATVQTGDTLRAYCLPPEGKVLDGWYVYYYSWKSPTNPGAGFIDVATDEVKTDGQLIAEAVNESGTDAYTVQDGILEFRINEKMVAVRDDTPLRIYVRPLFRSKITEITGVPETMTVGGSIDLADVQVVPSGAAAASDIDWKARGSQGPIELNGSFAPAVCMAYTLEASVPQGDGAGSDYVQTFRVYVHHGALDEVPAAAATCTTEGNLQHWKCPACGELFLDAAGETPTTAEAVKLAIDPNVHDLAKVSAVAPTCTTDGVKEHWKCSRCGALFVDDAGQIPTTADDVVDPAAHNLEKVPAVAATCTAAGNTEHWKCTECEALFADEEGQTPTTAEAVAIAIDPDAHDWGEAAYTWADDDSSVTAERVCANDATHTETKTATVDVSYDPKPTATEDGIKVLTATFAAPFETQVKRIEVPAFGEEKVKINLLGQVEKNTLAKVLFDFEVSSEDAAAYGYGKPEAFWGKVTMSDAAAALHREIYGEEFENSPESYLKISDAGTCTLIFGEPAYMNDYRVNDVTPEYPDQPGVGSLWNDTPLADGDDVRIFQVHGETYGVLESYLMFDKGAYVGHGSGAVDVAVTGDLTFGTMMGMPADVQPAEGAVVCAVTDFTDPANTKVAEATTSENGVASFANLPAGEYHLVVVEYENDYMETCFSTPYATLTWTEGDLPLGELEIEHVGTPLWVAGKPAEIAVEVPNLAEGEVVTKWYWEYTRTPEDPDSWKRSGAATFADGATCTLAVPECTKARKAPMSWRATATTSMERTATSAGQSLHELEKLSVEATGEFAWVEGEPVDISAKVAGLAPGEELASVQWYYSRDGKTWKRSGAKAGQDGNVLTLSIPECTKVRRAPMAWSVRVTTTDGRSATSGGISLVG